MHILVLYYDEKTLDNGRKLGARVAELAVRLGRS